MPTVSVIIPAMNEEKAIGTVVHALRQLALDMEIIVVNDGSTDQTSKIAREAGAIVINHPLSLGAGKSVKDGILHASSEYILMIDADCTYPVKSVPMFIAKLEEGFDLVVGARHGKEYRGRMLKYFARWVFRLIAEFSTGKRIPDINSGMRAFRKSQIVDYFPHLCNGFSLPTTMTLSYFFTGRQVTYIPIEYYKRVGTTKVKIIRDSLRTLQYITESVAYFNPLKIFLLLALVIMVVGSIAAAVFTNVFIIFFAFFIGILVFSMGLIAENLRRTLK